MQQEPMKIGGTSTIIFEAYFLGRNFREYPRNSYVQKMIRLRTSILGS